MKNSNLRLRITSASYYHYTNRAIDSMKLPRPDSNWEYFLQREMCYRLHYEAMFLSWGSRLRSDDFCFRGRRISNYTIPHSWGLTLNRTEISCATSMPINHYHMSPICWAEGGTRTHEIIVYKTISVATETLRQISRGDTTRTCISSRILFPGQVGNLLPATPRN